jgi:hypothetical protein
MLYLVVKHSHMGADVDRLAFSLHHPTVCIHQRGSQSLLTGAAPSCHAVVGSVVFPEDVKPPSLDILCGVDCLGACKTESYMENPTFTRAVLSNVRVIMVIVHIPLVESLCQAKMR